MAAARGLGLGLSQGQRRLWTGHRPGEPNRALLDGHTLFDVDLHDLAGDLGRDGGAAAGRHVAGGVQDRSLLAGRALGHGCSLDFERPRPRDIPCARGAHNRQHEEQHDPLQPGLGPGFVAVQF